MEIVEYKMRRTESRWASIEGILKFADLLNASMRRLYGLAPLNDPLAEHNNQRTSTTPTESIL